MNGMDHGELQAENGAWARPVPFQRVMDKVKRETEASLANQPVKVDVVRKEKKPRPHKKG